MRVKSAALRYIFSWVVGCLVELGACATNSCRHSRAGIVDLPACEQPLLLCLSMSVCVCVCVCVSVTTFAAVSVAYAPVSFAHMRRAAFDN